MYGKQEGDCAGCCTRFKYQNPTLDHAVPRAKGGQDADENLQLLCGHCNSVKGGRLDNAGLRARPRWGWARAELARSQPDPGAAPRSAPV